jgi:hypothetical protein
MNWFIKEQELNDNTQVVDEETIGEQTELKCKEIPKEDESFEEIKSRAIFLKINQKQLISDHLFPSTSDVMGLEDVTHYTVEAQKIATKWKEEREI